MTTMNRFIVDHEPDTIAQALCDQHVVKMPLEEAQMLCTALWHHRPEYAERRGLYKPVHQKHPCTLWAMETNANYRFAWLTPHPQCFSGHDDCKTDEDYPINAYRAFYKRDKVSFARWRKNRDMPEWFMDA